MIYFSTHGTVTGEQTGIGNVELVAEVIRGIEDAYRQLMADHLAADTEVIPVLVSCHAGSSCRLLSKDLGSTVMGPAHHFETTGDQVERALERGETYYQSFRP